MSPHHDSAVETDALGDQTFSANAESHSTQSGEPNGVVMLSGRRFFGCCAFVAILLLILGHFVRLPVWLMALEVFATILGLFLFGSMKYQIHKNALTYGAGLIISATFLCIWWPDSDLRELVHAQGWLAAWPVVRETLFSFHGLNHLIHADTMLFILGLTFFVAVIAQTRLLESITFLLLRRTRGHVLWTVLAVTGVVSFASGILDGVSMIGLTIRTLIIILAMAKAPMASMRYAVMICTIVTTVCGMWLAYGEPPNLIMKANLLDENGHSLLTDSFFLKYCLPGAMLVFGVVAWSLRGKLRGMRVDVQKLDIIEANIGTIRFLQASKYGTTWSAVELLPRYAKALGNHFEPVIARVKGGQTLGGAMVDESVPAELRRDILAKYTSTEIAVALDEHYVAAHLGHDGALRQSEARLSEVIHIQQRRKITAQRIGALALLPFIGLLIAHGVNHQIPLFFASFAGFLVALLGIVTLAPLRRLAFRDAKHEYAEYLFLFPLFLSISLLSAVGFFGLVQSLLQQSILALGPIATALAQLYGATFLSALLDNNVVADFASHGLHGLSIELLHLFSLAQIAGYATGGCWTHIGSAQSVVAYSFIQREIDGQYTPLRWIREMTPVLLAILLTLTAVVMLAALVFDAPTNPRV